ncbi:MAG: hypothetical protein ACLSH8_17325 [Zhenhengia sp.]|jgi:methylglyoxal reductase|uniref:hypothetical protein n=1 Tax=Zhenhengia sp. TaxID=2944208 RepID=UPI003994ADAB
MLKGWEGLTKKYGWTMAQLVITCTMAQKNMSYVLCGARKPQHIIDIACAAKIALIQEDIQIMNEAITKIGA